MTGALASEWVEGLHAALVVVAVSLAATTLFLAAVTPRETKT